MMRTVRCDFCDEEHGDVLNAYSTLIGFGGITITINGIKNIPKPMKKDIGPKCIEKLFPADRQPETDAEVLLDLVRDWITEEVVTAMENQ